MDKGKVIVIIPCFNHGKYIDEAVNSVLQQTYRNFEIIIINDGSTDEYTNDLLKNYNKPHCTVVHTENKGLSSARNLGLKLASGNYIQFLDADDLIAPNKFELQVAQLVNQSNYSISYCDYFASKEDNLAESYDSRYLTPRFKTNNYLEELINNWETKLSIPCHCFLFNSWLFKEQQISFDEKLPNHEDWDCWISVFALKPMVFFVDKKLAIYRISNTSMSNKKNSMREGFLMAIEKQKNKWGNNPKILKLLNKRYNQIKRKNYLHNRIRRLVSKLFKKTKKLINKTLRINAI